MNNFEKLIYVVIGFVGGVICTIIITYPTA